MVVKVDLHLHSDISNKIGDHVGWISLQNTLNKIRNEDIQILCFTNHDMFSFRQYIDTLNIIAKNQYNMICYPGFELTILREDGCRGHVLFIFDNNDIGKIHMIEGMLTEIRFTNQNGVKIDKAKAIFDTLGLDYFIIPHVDKSDFVIYKDLVVVKDKLYYVESWEHSAKYIKFIRDAGNIDIMPIKFSDHHDWKNNNFKWSGTYLDSYNSFEDLKRNLKLERTVMHEVY